jgi:hypothetical protein
MLWRLELPGSELESDGDVRVAGETLCDVCVADEFLRVAIREGGKCSGNRPPAKRIYRWVVGLICCIAIGTACERMRRVGSFGVPVNSNLNELTDGANDRAS